MAQRWLILGAGGHGRSVCDAIAANGDYVVGFLDDGLPAGTPVNGTPVLGVLSLAWDWNRLFEASVEAPPDQVVVAIGNPALRQTWQQVLEQVAAPLGVVLHPRAIVSATASLHQGVLVNRGAVVDHDAICGAYSHLGVNAALAGGSRLGPLACLAPGEVLACGQTRFAPLALAPGASDPGEGLTLRL